MFSYNETNLDYKQEIWRLDNTTDEESSSNLVSSVAFLGFRL